MGVGRCRPCFFSRKTVQYFLKRQPWVSLADVTLLVEFINVFPTFGLKEWKTYIRVNQIVETKSGVIYCTITHKSICVCWMSCQAITHSTICVCVCVCWMNHQDIIGDLDLLSEVKRCHGGLSVSRLKFINLLSLDLRYAGASN